MSKAIIDTSRRVKAEDFDTLWFQERTREIAHELKLHRKLWEFCMIAQVYKDRVVVGGKVLGFGVGKECLPAWFANNNAEVIATDLPGEDPKWLDTKQQSLCLDDLPYQGICDEEIFQESVTFLPVNMNDIPTDLLQGEFDLTWSCGSFEHIGGLENSIDFFCKQMSALKPGGVAVHTTELNISNTTSTINSKDLVLFRGIDLIELGRRLKEQGDTLLTLDLSTGYSEADKYVDPPPYEGEYHLNIAIGGFISTSIVLIAIRGDGSQKSKVEVVEDNRKPTVLWVGDAVVSSGFAACTHAVCDHLSSLGWDIHILGLNYFGDPHSYPYPIYPCRQPFVYGYDGFGVGRLPHLIDSIQPDIVVLLNDPWNIPAYLQSAEEAKHKPKMVGWLAVDAENQKGSLLNSLDSIIVWTRFAQEELEKGGCTVPISIVSLGVDLFLFTPRDRKESREKVCPPTMPANSFIVGVVGRNQYRKRLDLTIQYFAEWVKSYNINDAYLYLHVAPTGDRGVDIHSLVKYYGMNGKVILSSPSIGQGESLSLMPYIYSSFDVYLTTTQGEGWGLPTLEAMACGIPCIVPDWSALGSAGWTSQATLKVECTSTGMNAPINSLTYTIGGIPDRNQTISALHELYSDKEFRDKYRERGIAQARLYSWDNTRKRFEEELRKIIGD